MKIRRIKYTFISAIILLVLIFPIFKIWWFFKVPNKSMIPTVPLGSQIVAQRYMFSNPKRNDIIVFKTKGIKFNDEPLQGKLHLKRLIGLPGDELHLEKGILYVNNIKHPMNIKFLSDLGAICLTEEMPKYIVPKDHFFVLGDNVTESLDSRYFGSVPVENLWGKMIFIIK